MGKKRKLEAQQPAYEDDYGSAAHGAHDTAATKRSDASGSRCDPELVSYLTEVSQHAAAVTDAEERQLLVANVLEEIQGKELRVASDAVTSRLLEVLLVGAPGNQLMQFMQAFTNEDIMFSFAGSAFGSHVAEKVLVGLHQQAEQMLQDAEQAQQFEELLSGMVGAIGGHLYDYIMDKHATHVARGLLVVIAGRDVLSPVGRKKQPLPQHLEGGLHEDGGAGAAQGSAGGQGFKSTKSSLQEKLEGLTDAAGQRQSSLRCPALLRRYAKMLPLYDASSMMLLGKNSYSSPFVQAVLRAAVPDQELLQLLLPPILGVDTAKAAAAEPGQVLSNLTDSHMGRLLRDECYSHLLEVVIAVMPQALKDEFYIRFLKGRMLPLATHHSANFVIQAWIAACNTPQQVQDVLGELQHHLPDLLKRRRSGVAAALVAAAGRAGGPAQQAAAATALVNALTALPQWQGREGSGHVAPALLTLDTNASLGSSSSVLHQQQQYGSSTRLSTPGAAILCTLLTHYNKKAAKPFAESIAALSAADASRVAKDPAGSRVLQALIEGGVASAAAKKGLLDKLAGCWGDVALQGAGSFFLEKAYAWGDLAQKEAIVAEVLLKQSRLMAGCPWGPLLVRKLSLEAYARSPEEWRKRATSATAAKREFEQLIEQDLQPSTTAVGGVHEDGNKKRRRQEQQEQQQQQGASAVCEATSCGDVHSSKKARKLARKQKHSEAGDRDSASAAAAAASFAAEGLQQPSKKKQKEKHETGSTRKKKRKHLEGGAAAGANADDAAGVGAIHDFVALLGFGGLVGEQHSGTKLRS